jgi:hypothetical protein
VFDEPDKMMISGVDRGEQLRLYDARRAEQIPAHGLGLVLIQTSGFRFAANMKVDRSPETDIGILRNLLCDPDHGGVKP